MCLSLVKSEVYYASRLKKYIWTLDLRACDQKPERFSLSRRDRLAGMWRWFDSKYVGYLERVMMIRVKTRG